MFDTFAHEAWTDIRKHPILNGTNPPGVLTDWYMAILVAGIVNYLWTEANIYAYCMEMTKSQCM